MNSTSATIDRLTGAGHLRGLETLDHETVVADLPSTGTFPAWLAGSLYRNGPAKFEIGAERLRHWFDGYAMLHRFTIAAGRVGYANRYLNSTGYDEARRYGKIMRSEFGTKARVGLGERLRRLRGDGGATPNANVNIVPCGDELHALTELPTAIAFDAVSLETTGARPATSGVPMQTITAHPHHDAARGRSINLGIEFGRTSKYHVVSVADGSRTHASIGSLAVDKPAYFHTFAVTHTYAVIVEFPLVLDSALDLLLDRRAFVDNYTWRPERGTRFHAMRLDDGTIARTWQGAPFFAFHHINAYDEGDAIVLDVSAYDDAGIVADLGMDPLRRSGARFTHAEARRYRLDPRSSTAEYETLATVATELPRINPKRFARDYGFVYGVGQTPERPDALATALVKVATRDRSVTWWAEPEAYPGEPVFVARPGATAEDDGIVLSVVLDAADGTSFLLALDAATFHEIARARVPHHVPFGFHGLFVRA